MYNFLRPCRCVGRLFALVSFAGSPFAPVTLADSSFPPWNSTLVQVSPADSLGAVCAQTNLVLHYTSLYLVFTPPPPAVAETVAALPMVDGSSGCRSGSGAFLGSVQEKRFTVTSANELDLSKCIMAPAGVLVWVCFASVHYQ